MNSSLTKLTDTFSAGCGCILCQGNVIGALDRKENKTYLALESLCAVEESKINKPELAQLSAMFLATLKNNLPSSHKFAANSRATIDLLQTLNTTKPYYCVAVCIFNPSAVKVTYEHRFVLVKGDAANDAFMLQAYSRDDLNVTLRATTAAVNAAQVVTDLETLLSQSTGAQEKRKAYATICGVDETILAPVLNTIDWNKMKPTLVAVGFQGSADGIDEYCKAYIDATKAQQQ